MSKPNSWAKWDKIAIPGDVVFPVSSKQFTWRVTPVKTLPSYFLIKTGYRWPLFIARTKFDVRFCRPCLLDVAVGLMNSDSVLMCGAPMGTGGRNILLVACCVLCFIRLGFHCCTLFVFSGNPLVWANARRKQIHCGSGCYCQHFCLWRLKFTQV